MQVPEGVLGRPTLSFCTKVVDALGLPALPERVQAEAFCTPFFSEHAASWRDRIRQAWRIEIALKNASAPQTSIASSDRRPFRKSFGICANDETVSWSPEPWANLPLIVIGDFPLGNWGRIEAALNQPGLEAPCVERLPMHSIFEQVRIHLGKLPLPELEARVQEVERRIAPFAVLKPFGDLPKSAIARPKAAH